MQDFIKISKYAGMREDLVQAGGGNSSYKITPDRMLIKASGYQLSDITEAKGYAEVNPLIIKKAFMECENLDSITDIKSKEILQEAFIKGERPSIETFLHAISGKYTLHTHPIAVNIMTCRKNGMEILQELFPEALIIPYATPGAELAKTYFTSYLKEKRNGKENVNLVFMQNHGLVVSGENANEVIQITEEVNDRIADYLNINLSDNKLVTELFNIFQKGIIWKVTDQNVLQCFKKHNNLWTHTFCPDCIVFLGKKILKLTDKTISSQIDEFRMANGEPAVLEYHGQLFIHTESVRKAFEIQSVLSFSAQVMAVNMEENINFLSDKEQNFLLDWDAEKYRKNMK